MIYLPIIAITCGLIYFLYPRIENYFVTRPKLIIEIEENQGITSRQNLLRYSSKNPPISEGPDEMWYVYEFEWLFNLIVRNNSEINAYEIKLMQKNGAPNVVFQREINFQKALKSHEEIELPFKISTIVECQGKDRENIFGSQPDVFKNLMVLLEYKNPKGRNFHSAYSFNTNKTDLKRRQSYELQYNWH